MIKGRVELSGTVGDSNHWFLVFWFFTFSISITKHLTACYVAVTEFIVDSNKPQKFTGKKMLALIFTFL